MYTLPPLHHPFANKNDLTIHQFQNQTSITTQHASPTPQYLHHLLKSNPLKPPTFLTFTTNQPIKQALIHPIPLSLLSKYLLHPPSIPGQLPLISLTRIDFKRTFSYLQSPMTRANKNNEFL
ncbi:LysR substrate-binding domain-containing protein, partial [Bacillus altitudinis]|uniref:LysR substrate-binding domain-containing protein n=1 Tax=Bacillus altitudinis TaxID=293387 RepID=UPI003B528C8C